MGEQGKSKNTTIVLLVVAVIAAVSLFLLVRSRGNEAGEGGQAPAVTSSQPAASPPADNVRTVTVTVPDKGPEPSPTTGS